MNIYKCFYNGKEIEVEASTTYEAQIKAAKVFKAKKSYKVNVMLLSKDNIPVIHLPLF